MAKEFLHPVVVVCGPTATGKSELAQNIAERLKGVVLSADSMQVYRGMDIGTAKIPQSQQRVPHFGIDLANPDELYSASLYQTYGREVVAQNHAKNAPVVVAGGTGLYIQSLIDDLQFPKGEEGASPVRDTYEKLYAEKGALAVWEELNEKDPLSAQEIHPNNVKRVIRALEMMESGESYAQRAHGLQSINQVIPALFIGLSGERSVLYDRINKRVDIMREQGLENEVKNLVSLGFGESITSKQAIGYKEILDAFEGRCSLDEAYDQIKQASRRYAKRQLTWFRRDTRIHWINVTENKLEQVTKIANTLIQQELHAYMNE